MAKKIETNSKQIVYDNYFGFKKIRLDMVASIFLKQVEFKQENLYYFVNQDIDLSNLSIRAYALHEVIEYASKQTEDLVNYLDNFPDINYYSLFDHFRVVICSPKIKENLTNSNYEFYDKNNNVICFNNLDDAQKYFDFYLIKEKITIGVLVGDRDGDHFFISYFL